MANETIFGCVDWADGGKVKFTQDDCEYEACVIWDGGVHHGQVAITLDNFACSDTYYGCINWATGQFQIILPDTCCVICEHCGEAETPENITVEIADVADCACYWNAVFGAYFKAVGADDTLNGIHVLAQNALCQWTLTDDAAPGSGLKAYSDDICTNETNSWPYTNYTVTVTRNAGDVTVEAKLDALSLSFDATEAAESGCVEGTYTNTATCTRTQGAVDGTAEITE